MKTLNQIKFLLSTLEKAKVIKSVGRGLAYPDEPPMYRYSALLHSSARFSDGVVHKGLASGFSFHSAEEALLKCLSESAERFADMTYRERRLVFCSYEKLAREGVDPYLFTHQPESRQKVVGWLKGTDFLTGQPCYVPAQSIYFNYRKRKLDQADLAVPISTGCAGGFGHQSTLLRALYEVVERDAFMTTYLTKHQAPRIDLNQLQFKEVAPLLKIAARYNLEARLFDITNDLGIPTFLGCLIDRTGLGVAFSLGAKSAYDVKTAILGSLAEAFNIRPWMRHHFWQHHRQLVKINPNKIADIEERALFWMRPNWQENLQFLFKSPLQPLGKLNKALSEERQLNKLKEVFKKQSFNAYYADITPKYFQGSDYLVYKAVIPQLQPLYLHEPEKKINQPRLKKVSRYFGQPKLEVNAVPHPFL